MKPENTQIRICMICGDKWMDQMMHAADVFEPPKMLAEPRFLTATLDGTKSEEAVIAGLAEAARKEFSVAAVFIVGTGIGWINEMVKLVSNGEGFCTLDVMLRRCGYIPATESSYIPEGSQ